MRIKVRFRKSRNERYIAKSPDVEAFWRFSENKADAIVFNNEQEALRFIDKHGLIGDFVDMADLNDDNEIDKIEFVKTRYYLASPAVDATGKEVPQYVCLKGSKKEVKVYEHPDKYNDVEIAYFDTPYEARLFAEKTEIDEFFAWYHYPETRVYEEGTDFSVRTSCVTPDSKPETKKQVIELKP